MERVSTGFVSLLKIRAATHENIDHFGKERRHGSIFDSGNNGSLAVTIASVGKRWILRKSPEEGNVTIKSRAMINVPSVENPPGFTHVRSFNRKRTTEIQSKGYKPTNEILGQSLVVN